MPKTLKSKTREPETFNPVKRGPQSAEARASVSAATKQYWNQHRRTRIEKMNGPAHGIESHNAVRSLRLRLKNAHGEVMSQTEFGLAIGLGKSCQKTISSFENGLKPAPLNIRAMERLAESQGIAWKYE